MFEGLLKNTIYVKIKQELLVVRLIEAKKEIQGKPLIVLDRKPGFLDGKYKVLACGDEALMFKGGSDREIEITNAFNHPRIIISDLEAAEATLRYFISKLINRAAFFRPSIILHPLDNIEGGLSQAEVKMLIDIGMAAGARKAMVLTGRELSDYEIENQQFPAGDGKLFEYDPSKRIKELTSRSSR